MKRFLVLLLVVISIACQKEKSTKNFVLTGNIKGFKEGKLYIQRVQDTILVPVDSVIVSGNSEFNLEFDLEQPEMLYLFINRGVSNSFDNNIPFFAEPGTMRIETSLDFFTTDAKISGSKNQELYEEYKKVANRFIDKDLELVAKRVTAYKNKETKTVDSLDKVLDRQKSKKYLYTTNFAINHPDNEVTPYIVLAEIYDINLKYLDTINKTMSPKVKKSLYGSKFVTYYNERKKEGK